MVFNHEIFVSMFFLFVQENNEICPEQLFYFKKKNRQYLAGVKERKMFKSWMKGQNI